jgi:hypothetical protein
MDAIVQTVSHNPFIMHKLVTAGGGAFILGLITILNPIITFFVGLLPPKVKYAVIFKSDKCAFAVGPFANSRSAQVYGDANALEIEKCTVVDINQILNHEVKINVIDPGVPLSRPEWQFKMIARKTGRPRIEDISKTIEARKPWLKLEMSRRTWYRRQAEKRKGRE